MSYLLNGVIEQHTTLQNNFFNSSYLPYHISNLLPPFCSPINLTIHPFVTASSCYPNLHHPVLVPRGRPLPQISVYPKSVTHISLFSSPVLVPAPALAVEESIIYHISQSEIVFLNVFCCSTDFVSSLEIGDFTPSTTQEQPISA